VKVCLIINLFHYAAGALPYTVSDGGNPEIKWSQLSESMLRWRVALNYLILRVILACTSSNFFFQQLATAVAHSLRPLDQSLRAIALAMHTSMHLANDARSCALAAGSSSGSGLDEESVAAFK